LFIILSKKSVSCLGRLIARLLALIEYVALITVLAGGDMVRFVISISDSKSTEI
jgi:hypothetical protein